MSVAELQPTEELWKSIMKRKQLEMDLKDLALSVKHN
jgi:hypothetical protein